MAVFVVDSKMESEYAKGIYLTIGVIYDKKVIKSNIINSKYWKKQVAERHSD